jgi:putative ABC transport system permease protein
MFMRILSFETDILGALHGGGQRGTSIRYAFKGNRQFVLIAQIALSATLLISMAVAALALRKATDSPLGFNAEGVSVTDLALKESTNTAAGSQYVRDIVQRVSMLSGVEKVALASGAPFEDTSSSATFTTEDTRLGGGKELQYVAVSPEFFRTMQTAVLRGRMFANSDASSSPKVVVLNQAAARTLFGVGQGLMQQLKGNPGRGESTMRVVGIVENIRQDPTTVVAPPIVYLPLAQAEAQFVSLIVRASSAVGNAELKSQIWALNANQAVPTTTRLVDLIDASLRRIRYIAFLMTLFATATMLLSSLGIYAAVAHWLSTSQKEIAVCIALGASYSEIRGSILTRIMAVTGVAFAIGSVAALAASNSIRAFLYGVQPQFGAAFVWAASLLGATALLSSYMPALRSRFVDPAELLRSE